MEERRVHPRKCVDWRVKFTLPGEELSNGFLSDANATGVNIMSSKEYPVGTIIEVHFGAFQDDPENHYELDAVVRHTAPGEWERNSSQVR
jgi:hypothetical protein